MAGTFSEGHEFTIIGENDRGLDLKDDEGNRALEVPTFKLEIL